MDQEQLKDFFRYALSRLDVAWFRMTEKKYGINIAYEIDSDVMEDWYMRMARYVKKMLNLEDFNLDTYFKTFKKAEGALNELFEAKGEEEFKKNKIITRTTQCSQWDEIQKAGFADYAKAGKMCTTAHIAAHRGMLKGLFPNKNFRFNLTKRIPAGDNCCEIEIELEE
ncbi:MAG: hypothetical protein ACFFAK_13570 [Promethearchaeota archaeon]